MLKNWSQRPDLPRAQAGWPKVPSSQHSHSLLSTLQPGTPGAAGTALGEPMWVWALAHPMCSGVMHCGNSDILHPCRDPDSVEAGSKDSLSSACSHEIITVMIFRKRLNIRAVKRHFPVMLTGTDTATAINLHVPGWKLTMGWSHCLPPLPPSRLCNHHPCSSSEVRGEGVTFLRSIRHQLRSLAGCCLRWTWPCSSTARVTPPPPSYKSWCSQMSPLARLTPSPCTCARLTNTYHLPQPLRSQTFRKFLPSVVLCFLQALVWIRCYHIPRVCDPQYSETSWCQYLKTGKRMWLQSCIK